MSNKNRTLVLFRWTSHKRWVIVFWSRVSLLTDVYNENIPSFKGNCQQSSPSCLDSDPQAPPPNKDFQTHPPDYEPRSSTSSMFGSSPIQPRSAKRMKKDKSTDSQNRIRLNHKASITRIETVTEVPKVWAVPHDEMAYLLDLTGQKELRTPDGEMSYWFIDTGRGE